MILLSPAAGVGASIMGNIIYTCAVATAAANNARRECAQPRPFGRDTRGPPFLLGDLTPQTELAWIEPYHFQIHKSRIGRASWFAG